MGTLLQSELEALFLDYVGAAPLDKIAPFITASGRINPLLQQVLSRVFRLNHDHLGATEHRDGIVAELTTLIDDLRAQFDLLKNGHAASGIPGLAEALGGERGKALGVDLDEIESFLFSANVLVMKLADGGDVCPKTFGAFVRDAEQKIAPPFDLIHRNMFGVFRDMAVFERTRHARESARQTREVEAAEARFKALAEIAPFGIVLSDADGTISFANEPDRILNADKFEGSVTDLTWDGLLGKIFVDSVPSPNADGILEGERADGVHVRILTAPLPTGGLASVWSDLSTDATEARGLESLAMRDALTGLPNRLDFLRRLDDGIGQTSQDGRLTALMLLDLDNFKKVNDTYGHPVGDALLCDVARRLKACLDPDDIVARLSSDEFAVICRVEEMDSATIFSRARTIVAMLGEVFEIRGYQIRTGCCIGITIYPHDQGTRDQMVQNADIALYTAKRAGRGMVSLFDRTMRQKQHEKQRMEEDLALAIERGQMAVHYQPQISLDTGEVIGVEALLRWQHPELGAVQPSRFIQVAEASGLIVPITNWLIAKACADVRAWSEAQVFCGGVSVNISPVQFAHSDLFATIRKVLDDTRIDPSSLEVEITETTIIEERYDPEIILNNLKELGVRIAIDDFGMGYSSFSRLKNLKIDRLKVDQSFVADMTIDEKNLAIASTIINLGTSLQLNVIAEGVETAEQFRLIRKIGCNEVQGFFISRPLATEELLPFLTRHDPKQILDLLDETMAA